MHFHLRNSWHTDTKLHQCYAIILTVLLAAEVECTWELKMHRRTKFPCAWQLRPNISSEIIFKMSILINIIKGLRNYKNYCKILTLSNSDEIWESSPINQICSAYKMNSMLVLEHILDCTLRCFLVNNYMYCKKNTKENQKWTNLWKDTKILNMSPLL